jgi:hypothetical protein
MTDERVIKILRAQAWERAKGELKSILHSYWGESAKFRKMDDAIDDFIEKVENEGLQV